MQNNHKPSTNNVEAENLSESVENSKKDKEKLFSGIFQDKPIKNNKKNQLTIVHYLSRNQSNFKYATVKVIINSGCSIDLIN